MEFPQNSLEFIQLLWMLAGGNVDIGVRSYTFGESAPSCNPTGKVSDPK